MAVSFRCVRNDKVNNYPLAVSQTIAVGDPVILDANGQVTVAATTSAALLGVAASACTVSASGDTIIVHDDPAAEFEGPCDTANQNVQAEVGDTCDIAGSTGAFSLNLDAASYNVVQVLKIGSYINALLDGTFTTFDPGTLMRFKITAHALEN